MRWRSVGYNPAWASDPILQAWVSEDPEDPERGFCRICMVSLLGRRDSLRRHGREVHGYGRNELDQTSHIVNQASGVHTNNIAFSPRNETHIPAGYSNLHTINNSVDLPIGGNDLVSASQENDAIPCITEPSLNLDVSNNNEICTPMANFGVELSGCTHSFNTENDQIGGPEISGGSQFDNDGRSVNLPVEHNRSTATMQAEEMVSCGAELLSSISPLARDELCTVSGVTGVELSVPTTNPITCMSEILPENCHDCDGLPANEDTAETEVTETESSCDFNIDRLNAWRRRWSWIEEEPVIALGRDGVSRRTMLRCSVCKSLHKPQTSVLDAHDKTVRHGRISGDLSRAVNFDREKVTAEIEMCATYIYKALSFNTADFLGTRNKVILHDSEIAKKMELHRRKMPKIAHNVIMPCHINLVSNNVRGKKYVIQADASTDDHNMEMIVIALRYFDRDKGQIVEVLFEVFLVYDGDEFATADADTVSDKIEGKFVQNNIPLEDCLALETDGAPVFQGGNRSVLQRIRVHNVLIDGYTCYCHVVHLVPKDSMNTQFKNFEEIPHLLYTWCKRSPKKDNRRLVLQLKLHTEALKMENPTVIRWLSFFKSWLRITRLYSMLEKLARTEKNNEANDEAVKLDKYFSTPSNKPQHFFFLQVFSKFYIVEKKLQSGDALPAAGRKLIRDLFIYLLELYMYRAYIMSRPLQMVNPASIAHMKPAGQLSLDPLVRRYLERLSPSEQNTFMRTNREFVKNLCVSFRAKYDFSKDYLLHLQFLEPNLALNAEFHTGDYVNLSCVYDNLPGLTKNRDQALISLIDAEWQRLPTQLLPQELLGKRKPVDFWHGLSFVQDQDHQLIYPNLSEFALNCLILPHSNAKPERLFSTMNWQFDPHRGKMYFETKRALMLTHEHVNYVGGIENFEVTEEMILNYARHLNDPVKDTRCFNDENRYMNEEISENLRKRCRNENEFGKKLAKKLKRIIASDQPSLEFDLGNLAETDDESDDQESNNISTSMDHDATAIHEVAGHNLLSQCSSARNQAMSTFESQRSAEVRMYPHLLPNGLFADHAFYFTSVPILPVGATPIYKNYRVCRINRVNCGGQDTEIQVDSTDYQTMKPGLEESGRIIDACAAILERNWDGATFVSTDLTESFFAEWEQDPDDDWPLFSVDFPWNGKIFFPHLRNGNHWVLFTLNMTEQTAFFLDPCWVDEQIQAAEEFRCMTALTRFINLCYTRQRHNAISILRNFRTTRPNYTMRVYQNDAFSCADFDVNHMDVIAKNETFNMMFKPRQYRVQNAKMLLRESEPMDQSCIFCGEQSREGAIDCSTCGRFFHLACARGTARSDSHCSVCTAAQRIR
ncbi:hypothetical protein QAD02_016512 [Eretmocerus hayati]|uniref:Uncharacterized protein n=1 Tax=Eretmocerus hayati TaxID=131215 RepID=A0ACC2PAU2_9HYME|nr:hypothetical protein QAD02_016512 [Eretmocerus hayati]